MSYRYQVNDTVVVFPDEQNFLQARMAFLAYMRRHPTVKFLDYIRRELYEEGQFEIEAIEQAERVEAPPPSYNGYYYSTSFVVNPFSTDDTTLDTISNTMIDTTTLGGGPSFHVNGNYYWQGEGGNGIIGIAGDFNNEDPPPAEPEKKEEEPPDDPPDEGFDNRFDLMEFDDEE